MKNRPFSFLYSFLKPLISLGARLFYGKWEAVGFEKIPENKPVIIIANHQNAMMDPLLCCIIINRQLHWLTRADIFKSKFSNQLLRSVNMLPVFRERDKVGDLMNKNENTFNICYDRLNKNAFISMFPEGTHRGKKQLHVPLKKGLARLAFGALDRHIDMKELYIVPVGLDYEKYEGYKGNLLMVCGDPIPVHEYYALYKSEQAKAITTLMSAAHKGLKKVMIDIDANDAYEGIYELESISAVASKEASLFKRFDFYQRLTQMLCVLPEQHYDLLHRGRAYHRLTQQLRIKNAAHIDNIGFGFILIGGLVFLAGLPFATIALFCFSPLFLFTESIVQSKIKDLLFRNSIRMAVWTFLTPLWCLLLIVVLRLFDLNWTLILSVLGSVLLSGYLSLVWWKRSGVWLSGWRRYRLKKRGDKKYNEWLAHRVVLIEKISELNKR